VRGSVEGCWVEDSDAVPAGLDLNREMPLEAVGRLCMVEYALKGGVLECSAVDVTGDPVVVKDGSANVVVVHVVSSASDAGVVDAALVYEFEDVVYAGEDVVHEDDGVEVLAVGVAELVEGDEGGVADLCEVFDTVVEGTPGTHGGADGDAHADAAGEGVEDAEKSFCLVCGTVFVDGDVDVVVTEDGCDAEEDGKEVGDDVEGVVKIDGEVVFVLGVLESV